MYRKSILCFSLAFLWHLNVYATGMDSSIVASVRSFIDFVKQDKTAGTAQPLFEWDFKRYGNSYEYYVNSETQKYDKEDNNYKEAIRILNNFNIEYDSTNFKTYIFHGRYFLGDYYLSLEEKGMEQVYMPEDRENRLRLLKEHHIRSNSKMVMYSYIEDLRKALESELSKEFSNKRILVLMFVDLQVFAYQNERVLDESISNTTSDTTWLKLTSQKIFTSIQISLEEEEISLVSNTSLNHSSQSDDAHLSTGTSYTTEETFLLRAVGIYTSALWFSKVRHQILSTCNSSEALTLLEKVNPSSYVHLSLPERIHLLGLIANKRAGGRLEKMVLDILESTPREDAVQLLSELETRKNVPNCPNVELGCVLISELMYRIDDSTLGVGDDNYTGLMRAIISLIQKNETYFDEQVTSLFEDDELPQRTIIWGSIFGSNKKVGYSSFEGFKFNYQTGITDYALKTLIKKKEHTLTLDNKEYLAYTSEEWSKPVQLTKPLRPFDLVLFTDESNLSIINEGLSGSKYEQVPAIFLKYAHDKENKEIITTTTLIAIDILTIYKGVPAFTAAKGFKRAMLGFDMLNAAGNIVLNVSKEHLVGSHFEALVDISDMVMLGVGLKDGVASLPGLYKAAKRNMKKLNKHTIKYFLVAYFKQKDEIARLAGSDNISAKSIEVIYQAIRKDLNATEEGRALLKEAEDLAKSGINITKSVDNLVFLKESPELVFKGINNLKGVAFKTNDNIIDVIVHSKNDGYALWIDKVEYIVSESNLADIISKNIKEDQVIRLLSCSNLESAKKLSANLGNRTVYATEDLVKIHADGGITTIARSGNATQKWRKLKNGADVEDAPIPKKPEGEAVGKWVQMGDIPIVDFHNDLLSKVPDNPLLVAQFRKNIKGKRFEIDFGGQKQMCEVVDFDYPESIDNLVGFTAKQVDRMGNLTKEIISIPKNYGKVNGRTDAFELTKILSGSNNTWVKRAGKFGEENMTIGFQTIGNPKKEWYIDFDATTGKGAHYNWSDGVNRGAVLFNGTENTISQLKQQLTSTYGAP